MIRATRFLVSITLCQALAAPPAFAQGVGWLPKADKKKVDQALAKVSTTVVDYRKHVNGAAGEALDAGVKGKLTSELAHLEQAIELIKVYFAQNPQWWQYRDDVDRMTGEAKDVGTLMKAGAYKGDFKKAWDSVRSAVNDFAKLFELPRI